MVSSTAASFLAQLCAEGVSLWLDEPDAQVDPVQVLMESRLDSPPGFSGFVASPETTLPTIRAVCDALRPAFEETGGLMGRTSVGLAPWAAHDSAGLVAAARAVVREVERPNLLVRLPATPAGLEALSACLGLGIAVHIADVYSAGQYARVLTSYLAGMEQALANGVGLARLAFTASVPVGLLDDTADALLDRHPAPPSAPLRHQAGATVARLAYRERELALSSHWWRVLRSADAPLPLLAWTRTRPRHLGALVGGNTVLAVSLATLETAAREVQLCGDTLLGTHEQAARTADTLQTHGVDLSELGTALEARL
ncbi:transaldolase family protein [Kitasatospora sp. NPDC088391]|uniref:transaldolase family protein n=1 Tax=Kitasatospora sp. NPDC088391 TaxID=3364074 RepID=UPI00382F81A3